MAKYIARRIVESIPVIIGVSILVFMLLHLIPGDPATAMLGERATPENVEALRERLGLNKPLYEQYLDRKSTRLNSSHVKISYAVFCLKKKTTCQTRRNL